MPNEGHDPVNGIFVFLVHLHPCEYGSRAETSRCNIVDEAGVTISERVVCFEVSVLY